MSTLCLWQVKIGGMGTEQLGGKFFSGKFVFMTCISKIPWNQLTFLSEDGWNYDIIIFPWKKVPFYSLRRLKKLREIMVFPVKQGPVPQSDMIENITWNLSLRFSVPSFKNQRGTRKFLHILKEKASKTWWVQHSLPTV